MMLRRNVQQRLLETLGARRVTVVTGPRQAGKTTLVRQLLGEIGTGVMRSLDEPAMLESVRADPVGFVAGGPRPMVIDEVQRGGDPLVRAVKTQVDRDPSPGQFVLTGSSNFLTVPTISESLAGRAGFIEVWPFTQGELSSKRDRFADVAFADPGAFSKHVASKLSKGELLERIVMGGYSEVHGLPPRQRSGWFRDYVRTVIERDVVEIAGLRKVDELGELLRLFAARTACELVMQNIINDSSLGRQAVYDHRAWLETIHLLMRVPAWSRNLTQRVKRRPKVFVTDPGLAAWLLGKNAGVLSNPIDPAAGQLIETFVACELRRQITWADEDISMFHFQDRDGAEIDLILEARDGRVVAIEVKAGQTPKQEWFRWAKALRDRLGDSFVFGAALYTGTEILPFGDRLAALPISTLWEV